MKKIILFAPVLILGSFASKAQSVGPATVNSAGNSTIIGTNQFDWSVGEMSLVNTHETPGIIITQGVLQPSERDHTGITNTLLSKRLQVFPNPASSVVNIAYDVGSSGTLTYQLSDMHGKILTQKTVSVKPGITKEQLNVGNLANATYMLNITAGTDKATAESMSYKIEKIN